MGATDKEGSILAADWKERLASRRQAPSQRIRSDEIRARLYEGSDAPADSEQKARLPRWPDSTCH